MILLLLYATLLSSIAPQTTLPSHTLQHIKHQNLKKPKASSKKQQKTPSSKKNTASKKSVLPIKEEALPFMSNGIITDPHIVRNMSGLSIEALQSFQDVADKSHLALIFRSINPALRYVFEYISSIAEEIKKSPIPYRENSLYKFVSNQGNIRTLEPKPMAIKANSGLFPFIGPFIPYNPCISKLLLSSQKTIDSTQSSLSQLIKEGLYSQEPLVLTLKYLKMLEGKDLFPSKGNNRPGACSLSLLENPGQDIPTSPFSIYYETECSVPLNIPAHATQTSDSSIFSLFEISPFLMKYLIKHNLLPAELHWDPLNYVLKSQNSLPSLVTKYLFILSEKFLNTEVSIPPLTLVLSTQRSLLLTQLQAMNNQHQYISISPQVDPTLRRFSVPHTEELCRYFGVFFKKSITHLTLSIEFRSKYDYDKFLTDFKKKYPGHIASSKKKLLTLYITQFSPELFSDIYSHSYHQYMKPAQDTGLVDITHLRLIITRLSRHHILELHKLSPPDLYLKESECLPQLSQESTVQGHIRIFFPLRFIEEFSPLYLQQTKLEENVFYAEKATEDFLKLQYEALSSAKKEIDVFIEEFQRCSHFSEQQHKRAQSICKKLQSLEISFRKESPFFILFNFAAHTLSGLKCYFECLYTSSPHRHEEQEYIQHLCKEIYKDYIKLKAQWPDIQKTWYQYGAEKYVTADPKKRQKKLLHLRQHRPLICKIFLPNIQELKKIGEPLCSFLNRFPSEIHTQAGHQVFIMLYKGSPIVADADMASIGLEYKSPLMPQTDEFFRHGNFLCPNLKSSDPTLGFISTIERLIFQNVNAQLNKDGFPQLIAHGSVSSFPQNLLSLYCDLILILPHSPPCLLKDIDTYLHTIKNLANNSYNMQINPHFLNIRNEHVHFNQKAGRPLNSDEISLIQAQMGFFNHISQTRPNNSDPAKSSPITKELTSKKPPLFNPQTILNPLPIPSIEETPDQESPQEVPQAPLQEIILKNTPPSLPKKETNPPKTSSSPPPIIRPQKRIPPPLPKPKEIEESLPKTSSAFLLIQTESAQNYLKIPSSIKPSIPQRRPQSTSSLLDKDMKFIHSKQAHLTPIPFYKNLHTKQSPQELFQQNYGPPATLSSIRNTPPPTPDFLSTHPYHNRQKLARPFLCSRPHLLPPLNQHTQYA